MGNFNGYLDPTLDRHPSAQPLLRGRGTILRRLLQEVGWTDVWWEKQPTTRGSLSCIDLCVGSPQLLTMVTRVEYFPRGVADHSPLAAHLTTRPAASLPRVPWKLNAFWLKLFTSHERVVKQIKQYFADNRMHTDLAPRWDAFKAYNNGH